MRKGILPTLVLLAVVGAANATDNLITRTDFGDTWPFAFEQGVLHCVPGPAVFVFDPVGAKGYPLNGPANIQAYRLKLHPLAEVWRENPALPGTKVSVGPVIERGLKLCK